jgi:hypothetical protein
VLSLLDRGHAAGAGPAARPDDPPHREDR